MSNTLNNAPSYVESVDLRYFLEPLTGSGPTASYLDRFPDELYNKSPDTHFMRFMYVLLGPAGLGWLVQALLLLRLKLEAAGLENAELDAFYGDPLSFSRTLDEQYNDDLAGLLTAEQWAALKSYDESYRSRAIRYLHGVRLGNTPTGMQLVAESGLGENVEIVENYRALFDMHSDDPLGLPLEGSTVDLGEWIVKPRPAISRTTVVTISFDFDISGGALVFEFNGRLTPNLPWTTDLIAVQNALGALSTIGPGNVLVVGGPIPNAFIITFTGALANQSLPPLNVTSAPEDPLVNSSGAIRQIYRETTMGTIDASQEIVSIADFDKYSMQVAIDLIRPVGTFPTFSQGRSTQSLQVWQNVVASSENTEVLRYVTGAPGVSWPPTDNTNWIQSSVENEAPRLNDVPGHYVGFHNVIDVIAHTDGVFEGIGMATLPLLFPTTVFADSPYIPKYNSVHVGGFTPQICAMIPFFKQFNNTTTIFSASNALAEYPELLAITGQTEDNVALINRMYPITTLGLQGVPVLQRQDQTFWASQERPSGTEFLELDLGTPQAVNFVSFEITRKPIDIAVNYDTLDQWPAINYTPVTPNSDYPWDGAIFFESTQQNPWHYMEFRFDDGVDMIFTRFIQLAFTRRPDATAYGRFLYDPNTQIQTPWSIEVRNLRVGRNVTPALT